MFAKGAVEFDKKGYPYFIIMHTVFFISLIFEYVYFNNSLNKFWLILVILFFAAQFLRYWAIYSLGQFWNTRIIVLKNAAIVKNGPYKYFSHPNYLAVIIEIAAIPVLFSCYYTAVIFSIINIFVLQRRVKIEEHALRQ
jgi:methyltransferase